MSNLNEFYDFEWSERITDDYGDYLHHNLSDLISIWYKRPNWEVIIKSLIVAVIMLVGLVGNGILIFVILKVKSLRRSSVNILILNMALADFLTSLYLPWISLIDNIHQFYQLPAFFCKTQSFFKSKFATLKSYLKND